MDNAAARELQLYIDNDSQLYHQQALSIYKNLATKKARGVYNHEGAVKLFGYLVTNGAKKYAREFGGPGDPWNRMFDTATRKSVAENMTAYFETEWKLGNFHNLLPKKYQGPKKPAKTLDAEINAMVGRKAPRLSRGRARSNFGRPPGSEGR